MLMKLSINSTIIDRVLCAALLALYSTLVKADTVILETASMGSTCNCGGIAIQSSQFLGSRFHIEDAMTITRVGGHLTSGQNGAGGEIFAAIVQLAGPDAFPAGLPFAPGEVLATTLIPVPVGLSADVRVPLSVTLQPGDYLLVFGSGLFGATGEGSLTTVNPALSEPVFPVYNANNQEPSWVDYPITALGQTNRTMRLVVEAVQADGDGDGVPDVSDSCPGTVQGAAVDANGCSIDQLVPCNGPVSGGIWNGHGQYVSAVSATAEQFLTDGRITEEQKDAIIQAAAQSGCGRK